jgi:hypothetical protein
MKIQTYTTGQQVKVSGKWYHVIMSDGHCIKIIEDPAEIDHSKPSEMYGRWLDPVFVEGSRPAPDGVSYTRRGVGYKLKFIQQPLCMDSYVVTEHETGEEIGEYVHATKQSANIEMEAIIRKANNGTI